MIKARIYSDIHQEYRNDNELFNIEKMENEGEQILILAGDIDQLRNYKKEIRKEWLKETSARFKYVLYIFGNHEYYKGKIGDLYFEKNLDHLSGISNLHILSRKTPTFEIDNVVFIGATLWTDLYNVMFLDHNIINDVKSIKSVSIRSGYGKFGSDTWRNENNFDLEWIKSEVKKNDHKKIVVITHHAPIITKDPRDITDKYIHYNCNQLENFISESENISYWIHGHVHQKNNLLRKIGKTIIFSNTIGANMNKDEPERSFLLI